MSLPYDEQLKVWAAARYDIPLDDIDSVTITTSFYEGYDCCGGTDPDCYCSLAESARLDLFVAVSKFDGTGFTDSIDMIYGDTGKLLKEIIEA